MSVDKLESLISSASDEGKASEEVVACARAIKADDLSSSQRTSVGQAIELFCANGATDQHSVELVIAVGLLKPVAELSAAYGSLAREVFSAYPDPSAVQEALGEGTVAELANRFQVLLIILGDFSSVKAFGKIKLSELSVYHVDFGFGQVESVDKVTSQVSVKFKVVQKVPLKFFAKKSHILLPGTLGSKLVKGEKMVIKNVLSKELVSQIEAETVPSLKVSQAMITRLVMPAYIKTAKAFDEWYRRRVLADSNKKSTSASGRSWEMSRSLDELKVALRDTEELSFGEEEKNTLIKAFRFAAARPAQNKIFAESLAVIWELIDEKEYLVDMIQELAETASIWKDTADFVKVSTPMNVKTIAAWFAVTLEAKGIGYFAKDVMHMPIKFLNAIDKIGDEKNAIALEASAKTEVVLGNLSAAVACWLWNKLGKKPAELAEIITTPIQVFRALANAETADKSGKDLRKLIMTNEDYLEFLLGTGSDENVKSLVSTVKTFPGLDNGERQSLLVKIVRIKPDALNQVQERKVEVKVGKLPQVTSQRSYKTLQEEHAKLISTDIPENSKAIAAAREHGDLRENFEFRAAKDRQKYLQLRVGELDALLNKIGPTDFSEFKVKTRVIPASKVMIKTSEGDAEYSIVGVLDGDPDKNWLSFETPLAKSMLGHQAGDKIAMPDGGEAEILAVAPLDEDTLSFFVN
ncbi:GreA/GreB family elongation factor [Lentisphaera profundi]|uniref:GreA/GreB family elongation factor n=1 Tax=Lentisphaera profundi TaxID=1658616 RepID=A0ABY7VX42_9BACT|nr:GreA/GreB family elongation factor [Lentisphaera profundi]WDE98793.1 GreA/GreB family elongation factor [Lentisphaera profundi]